MPSRWSLLALGLGAYVAFCVFRFPAAVAYRWLAPEPLRLADIEGTVWSGGAQLGSLPGIELSSISWEVDALPLLLGRLGARVEARLADGFVSSDIVASSGRVEARNLLLSTDLRNLREALPIYGTEGQVSLNLERLVLEDGSPTSAAGQLQLREIRVAPLVPTGQQQMIELGSFRATFAESESPGIAGTVADLGGPLRVEGRIELRPDRSYLLEGGVAAREDASPDLRQGLTFMTGEPDERGLRPFEFPGSF